MAATGDDPYRTLGVSSSAGDADVRAAYRRLVQLHHPDHNGGSPESARRFEDVQEAYARVRELRAQGPAPAGNPSAGSPDLEERLAKLEYELRDARRARAREQAAREQARRATREAERAEKEARAAQKTRAEPQTGDAHRDEELGDISTDDSFTSIFTDARSGLSERLSDARSHPVAKRVSDLIDGLDGLASQLDRFRPGGDKDKRQR